jgi:hypothetical protein
VDAFVDFWDAALNGDGTRAKQNNPDIEGFRALSALRQTMMTQDDKMRAAFASALDPRFEERFLARAAAENAEEAQVALAAKQAAIRRKQQQDKKLIAFSDPTDLSPQTSEMHYQRDSGPTPTSGPQNPMHRSQSSSLPLHPITVATRQRKEAGAAGRANRGGEVGEEGVGGKQGWGDTGKHLMVERTRKHALYTALGRGASHALLTRNGLLQLAPRADVFALAPATPAEKLSQSRQARQELIESMHTARAGITPRQAKKRMVEIDAEIHLLEIAVNKPVPHVSKAKPELVFEDQGVAILGGLMVPWPLLAPPSRPSNLLPQTKGSGSGGGCVLSGKGEEGRGGKGEEGGGNWVRAVEADGSYVVRRDEAPVDVHSDEIMKKEDKCSFETLKAAALEFYSTPSSRHISVSEDAREEGRGDAQKLAEAQEEAVMRMVRQHASDALLNRINIRRPPIHEPVIRLPRKLKLDPNKQENKSSQLGAPRDNSSLNSMKGGVGKEDAGRRGAGGGRGEKELRGVGKMGQEGADRMGVEKATKIYKNMLAQRETHPWSSLSHVALSVRSQLDISLDDTEAIATSVDAYTLKGKSLGELVPSLFFSIRAPCPSVTQRLCVTGCWSNHAHLNGVYYLLDHIYAGRPAYRQETGPGLIYYSAESRDWNIGHCSDSSQVYLSVIDASDRPDAIVNVWREDTGQGFQDNKRLRIRTTTG